MVLAEENTPRIMLITVASAAVLSLFNPQLMAPLAMVISVIVAVLIFRARRFQNLISPPLVIAILFAIWAGITAFWTIDTGLTTKRIGRVAIVLVLGWVSCLAAKRLAVQGKTANCAGHIAVLMTVGLSAAIVASSAFFSEEFSALKGVHPINLFDRIATVFALIVWPLVCISACVNRLHGKWSRMLPYLIVFTFGAILAAIIVSPNRTALIGLAIGLVTFLICRYLGGARVITMAAVLGTVLVVPLTFTAKPASLETVSQNDRFISELQHRALIWQFVAERANDRLLHGWGLGVSRAIPGGDEKLRFMRSGQGLAQGQTSELIAERLPLHPHNAFLQVILELGLVGLLLLAALLLLLVRVGLRSVGPSITGRAAFSAFVVAALTLASPSYGAWQGWWLSTLLLAGVMTVYFARSISDSAPERDDSADLTL